MIMTRTPFRISFAGGGSDLAAFYEKHEGCVLSASINKYMYIMIHPTFNCADTKVKYSQTEIVSNIRDIKHPIAKQALLDFDLEGVEINSVADIPSGTGLASSSAYTVGLLHALCAYSGKYCSQEKIAKKACELEIEKLGEPIGKQDQYGCAVGGLKFIRFFSNGEVDVEPIILSKENTCMLNDNLIMFYVGGVHSAGQILKEQGQNISQKDKYINLVKMTELAYELKECLLNGELSAFGKILDKGWHLKRELANGITNPEIDKYYKIGIENGASGGKLLGAGGGGFLLFYCEKERQMRLRSALSDLVELPFEIDFGGSKVIYVGNKDWR